jgi:putative SOS response-associated peptidase YedK
MYYKLSNRVKGWRIEEEFKTLFRYPGIYRPARVINGLRESSLPIITMANPAYIEQSIWGILPQHWNDDWKVFQNYMNTLHMPARAFEQNIWYSEAFLKRRCLIIITGFYTYYLVGGELYPFHVGIQSGGPFCLAGIYNQLDDGFFTCSFITRKKDDHLNQIHNLNDTIPVTIPEELRKLWLSDELPSSTITNILQMPSREELRAFPVSKRILDTERGAKSFSSPEVYDEFPISATLKNILSRHNIIVNS